MDRIKQVSFALTSNGKYITRPTAEEIHLAWHSEEDYHRFKRNMYQDAAVLSVQPNSSSCSHEIAIEDMVGLDHIISIERYNAHKLSVKKHSGRVVVEQARQQLLSRHNIEDLARVSHYSSLKSKERARQIGLLLAS